MEWIAYVVAAVVLTPIVGFVIVRWWFKRWLQRKLGDYRIHAALIGDRYAQPARLVLQPAAPDDAGSAAFDDAWATLHALGFRALADYTGRDGAPERLRAAAHATHPVAAGLVVDGDATQWALFVLGDDQRLFAYSNGPGPSLQDGTLNWQADASLEPSDALERLLRDAAGRALRTFDARLFRTVYERAHARRMDALLAAPPQRALLEQAAAAMRPPLDAAQIDRALDIALAQWRGRIDEAVLDEFRQNSRIDAATWERIRDGVHVVHAQLRAEDVHALLVDGDADAALLRQLAAQGLTGIALYEQMAQRLPASRQRRKLGEVRRPLRAFVYAASEDADRSRAAAPHYYQATGDGGRTVYGSVVAHDAADAKRQLAAMDLEDGKVLIEPTPGGSTAEFAFDPELAALAARSARDSLPRALLSIVRGNWLLWLPPAALLANTLYAGTPFGWGDYAVFAYAVIAAAVLVLFVAPSVFYNLLLQHRVHARWKSARLCLAVLRRTAVLGGVTADQLLLEHCKILVGEGRTADAHAQWRAREAAMPPEQFAAGLVQLHDAAGDVEATIAAQRDVLALQPQDLARIDLAMSLARHVGADEAEALLAGIDPRALSELALGGFHFARGMILGRRRQFAQAIHQYTQAIAQAAQFRSNPLILGMLAEINGYVALALHGNGERERADALWRQVHPLLVRHPSCSSVIAQYEAAAQRA